jgi:hypothetical protein
MRNITFAVRGLSNLTLPHLATLHLCLLCMGKEEEAGVVALEGESRFGIAEWGAELTTADSYFATEEYQ